MSMECLRTRLRLLIDAISGGNPVYVDEKIAIDPLGYIGSVSTRLASCLLIRIGQAPRRTAI